MTNSIDTEIRLNGEQPVQTLRSLKSEVGSLTSAWKAEEIQLKSAGDNLNAAKSKYEGLSQAVNKQKEYVEKLKKEQAQIDQITAKGSESYAKFGTQIENANRKLASMEAQQTRAKDSWQYYSSGVAESKKKLEDISASSAAYVKRLQAEGKETEANKAKLGALKSTYSEMQSLYSKQATELERIASESGKTSDAYRKQEIRLNELGTKLANTKKEISSVGEATSKVKSSPFTRLKEALSGVNKEAKESTLSFKGMLGASFIGNALYSGVQKVTGSLKEAFKSGIELNEAGEKNRITWEKMGKDADGIKKLGDQVSDLKAKTGYAGGEIGNLQKAIDTVTHGDTQRTIGISQAITEIGLASRLSGEQTSSMGKALLKVASSATVSTGSLVKLEKQAPTLSVALAKAAGVTQEKFAEMVDNGEISGKKLQDLLYKAADQNKEIFYSFAKTSAGAQARMKTGWDKIRSNLAKPLFEVKASGLNSIASILESPVLQSAATAVGEGVKKLAEHAMNLLNSINQHKQMIGEMFDTVWDFAKVLAGEVWKTFSGIIQSFFTYVSQHKSDLGGIVKNLWEITKAFASDVWNIVAEVIKVIASGFESLTGNSKKAKDPIVAVKDVLDKLAKNKGAIVTIAKAFAAFIAIKGITSFAGKIANIAGTLKQISEFKGMPDLGKTGSIKTAFSETGTLSGKAGAVLGGVGVAASTGIDLVEAIQSKNPDTKFRKFGSSIGTAIGGGIGLFFGGPAGAAIGSTIGKFIGDFGGKAAKGFLDGWGKVGKGQKPEGFLQTVGFDTKKIVDSVGKTMGQIGKSVQTSLGKIGSSLSKNFNAELKATTKGVKNFGKDVSNLVSSIIKGFKKMGSDIGKEVSSVFKTVAKLVSEGFEKVAGIFSSTGNVISKIWKSMWNGLEKVGKGFWTGIEAVVKLYAEVIQTEIKTFLNIVTKVWTVAWNGIKSILSGVWTVMRNVVNTISTAIRDIIKTVLDAIHGNWNAVWKDISQFFGDLFNNLLKTADSIIHAIANVISTVINGIKSSWDAIWNGVKKTFSDVFAGLKEIARDALNGVISVINAAIGAINAVWNFFSGKDALGKLSYIKKANGGVVGREHLTMINDGTDSDWKELVQKPDGTLFMAPERNTILPLEEGTRVYNGSETRQIMDNLGIEHYAGGGIVGNIGKAVGGAIDWAKGTAENIASWVGDKWEAMSNFLKDPLKNVTRMIENAVSGMFKGLGNFSELAHGMIEKLLSPVEDWFKSKLAPLKEKHDDEERKKASSNAPGGGIAMGAEYWRPYVLKALEMNGLSQNLVGVVLSQISSESVIRRQSIYGTAMPYQGIPPRG